MDKKSLSLKTYELTAKLLAGENINVLFSQSLKAPAVFDVVNRILKIAPLEEEQEFLTMGLVVHEIGHALFTNPTADDIKKNKGFSKIFNIIEDGYQERKISKKYPGGKKYLFEIFEHFFIKDNTIDKNKKSKNKKNKKLLEIVNILNYNCKGQKHGYYLEYPSFVDKLDIPVLRAAEILNKEIYEERRQVASELSILLKKYMDNEDNDDLEDNESIQNGESGDDQPLFEDDEEPESNQNQQNDGSNSGNENDNESNDNISDNKDSDDNDRDSKNSSNNKNGQQNNEDQESNSTNDKEENERDAQEVEDALEDGKKYLNDHHDKLKHKINQSDNNVYSVPTYELLDSVCLKLNCDSISKTNEKTWNNDFNFAKKIANKIYTQFNMKKCANNLANTSHKKTGIIDPLKLTQYKITEDVFFNLAIEPNQTNHAYVIMLDWSYSMENSCIHLVHRIMELVLFANLAKVELEIQLYTTERNFNNIKEAKNYPDLCWNNSLFIKILNTKKSSELEINQKLRNLWEIAYTNKNSSWHNNYSKFCMGGTNILEGTIYGHGILEKMSADKKTLIILTDGDDEHFFTDVYDSSTGKLNKITKKNIKLLFNSFNVYDIISEDKNHHLNNRNAATKAFCDFRRHFNHETVCISWNTDPEKNEFMFGKSINIISNKTNDDYIEVENKFINELVSNLI